MGEFVHGANLAESCGHSSPAELARYIQIAMGSASELDYHLLLAHDLGFLDQAGHLQLEQQLTSVRKMLTSFRQARKEESRAASAPLQLMANGQQPKAVLRIHACSC